MERVRLAELARRAGITIIQAQRFVRAIVAELALGRAIRLAGLGEFRIVKRKARRFETPLIPGGVAKIPEHKVIQFRRFAAAAREINKPRR